MRSHETTKGANAPFSPAPAGPDRPHDDEGRGSGVALTLGSAASNQVGASLGAMAFPAIGPVGVVAVRQLVAATVLVLAVRPRIRGLTHGQWWPVLGLSLAFGVMNLCLYASVERVGLGMAVTLEFLGPLTVAALGSGRRRDLACAGLAAVGVLVLTSPGPTADVVGIGLGLVAAGAWAAYILLNRSIGRALPGLQGTALASSVASIVWLPVALGWFWLHPPGPTAILLAVGCGLLSSVVPYVADLLALRRVSAGTFGVLVSSNPVLAALAGLVLLGQSLDLYAWVGIGLIVTSNVVVARR